MTLQEAYGHAQNIIPSRHSVILRADESIDELDCKKAESLSIMYSYKGPLPNLSLFPNLTSFSCSRPVNMEYIAKQDLTKLKTISLVFENGAGGISILAPAAESLRINIDNDHDPQLDMFTCHDNTIFISNMPRLRQLSFWCCTWHKIIINGTMPSVEKVVFCNQDYTDYSILDSFPNLKELTITGCTCTDVSFLSKLHSLTKLDLAYNYILDVSPLLELPSLKKVNLYHTSVKNAQLLKDKGCYVIVTREDNSFERFKGEIWTALYSSARYVTTCRLPNSARPEHFQRFIDRKTDEEIFAWQLAYELKRLTTHIPLRLIDIAVIPCPKKG